MEEYRLLVKRIILFIGLIASVFTFGTIGYMIIEKWSFIESLFMTAITISTVGYTLPEQISNAGKIFSMILILSGVSIVLYGISSVTSIFLEGDLQRYLTLRRRMKMIEKMKDHHIIVGVGRTGRHIVSEFLRSGEPFVVIDVDEEKIKHLETLFDKEFPYVVGDASDEDTLVKAGVRRAKSLITTLPDDTKNVFVVLSARTMNPRLNIISRASDASAMRKLLYAGVTSVVTISEIAGVRMAMMAVNPDLISFLDVVTFSGERNLRMELIKVPENSPIVGKTLAELQIPQRTGLIIISMRKGGNYIFNPKGDTRVEAGNALVVLGDLEGISKMKEIVGKG